MSDAVLAAVDQVELNVARGGGYRVTLDEHGVGEVARLPVGDTEIVVVGGVFSPLESSVELVAHDVTEVQYAPDSKNATTVEVRGWDGRRIEGAEVFAVLQAFRAIERFVGTTDAEGRLRAHGIDDPRVVLRVEAPGYAATLFDELEPWYQGYTLALVLDPAASVLFRLRDSDGEPLEGVEVALERIDVHDLFARWPRERTNAEGEVRLGGLPEGTLRAYFADELHLHHHTLEVETQGGVETVVDHTLRFDQRISGVVRCNGVPVIGGSLIVSDRSLEVNGDGRFSGEVNGGRARPVYSSPGPERVRVGFPERRIDAGAEWTLDYRGHDVEIREIYPNSARPPLRTVRLVRQSGGGGEEDYAWLDLDGNETAWFRGLPAGRYLLRVEYRKPVASYAPSLVIDVNRDLSLNYEHREVTESDTAQSIPRGAQVSMIDSSGATTSVPVLRREPLRLAWPVATPGRGVIRGGGRAPVFFAVDELGRITPSGWAEAEGGVIDFWSFESTEYLHARLVPLDSTYGPAAFWEHERFSVWNEARVRAGRYRVTVFDGDRAIATREVDVVDGETTTLDP